MKYSEVLVLYEKTEENLDTLSATPGYCIFDYSILLLEDDYGKVPPRMLNSDLSKQSPFPVENLECIGQV